MQVPKGNSIRLVGREQKPIRIHKVTKSLVSKAVIIGSDCNEFTCHFVTKASWYDPLSMYFSPIISLQLNTTFRVAMMGLPLQNDIQSHSLPPCIILLTKRTLSSSLEVEFYQYNLLILRKTKKDNKPQVQHKQAQIAHIQLAHNLFTERTPL